MDKSWHIPRRTFLRGAGIGLALPTLDIMGSTAFGAESQAPMRYACMFHPNGVFPAAWDVKGEGKNYELSDILSPIAPVKEHVNIISNLDNKGTNGHVGMTSAFLCGIGVDGKGKGRISFDQMLANEIGHHTRFPSVQLGTEPPRQGNAGPPIAFANTVSWSSPTTRLSPEINPRVAFDRLFFSQNSKEAKQIAANRQSILDVVLEDAKSLRSKASLRDQQKIDEYLESVRSVESRIEKSLNPPERDWEPLTSPKLVRPSEGIPKDRDLHLKLMIDLMILAFQTDTTRVGTLMTAHGFSRQNFSFLDGVTSDHHGMSHHKNQAKAVKEYTTVSKWYVSQLVYMLEKMDSIDEGNGSLLDNSILLYGSSMKDGNGHKKENLPIIVAGGGSGTMKTGQHIVAKKNTPLANLHVSIGQKFGLEIDSLNGASNGNLNHIL